MDGGQFIVVVLGGIAGLVLIKYAATWFVKLLEKRPRFGNNSLCNCCLGRCQTSIITLAH